MQHHCGSMQCKMKVSEKQPKVGGGGKGGNGGGGMVATAMQHHCGSMQCKMGGCKKQSTTLVAWWQHCHAASL